MVDKNIWLWKLPEWFRDAGLDFDTWPGWETRSRSSGGYNEIYAIECHHTADSGKSLDASCRSGFNTAEFAPVGALRLGRNGKWVFGAAGATNTSGKGGPLACSRGIIPLNDANRYVISIEAQNGGTGEVWPAVQLDSYVRGVAAMIRGLEKDYGIKLSTSPQWGDIHAHFEWAPTRKIDPAGGHGQSPFAVLSDRYLRWDMDQFRAAVAAELNETPTPPPGGKKMQFTRWVAEDNGVRMYDSRPGEPKYHNANVPKTRLGAEPRKIAVAMAHVAEIRVTTINAEQPGHVIASGRPGVGKLPVVNFAPGRVDYDTRIIGLPDGHVYLWTEQGPVDVVVDLFGVGYDD